VGRNKAASPTWRLNSSFPYPRSRFQQHTRALASTLFCLLAIGVAAQQRHATTKGVDFWVGFTRNNLATTTLRLVIASEAGTTGTVTIPQQGWSTTFAVAANAVTTVALPASAATNTFHTLATTGVHIVALDTVSVTAQNHQGQSHGATSVWSLPSLGTEYRIQATQGFVFAGNLNRSQFLILATADGTQVEVVPSVTTDAGHPAGVPFTIGLDAGETYQVRAQSTTTDLTGSTVTGTGANGDCRPFALFGGANGAQIPTGCTGGDQTYDQLLPVDAWGTSHYIPLVQGVTAFAYRITAHQNGTQVSVNGGAPLTLSAGQTMETTNANQAVCITSSLPVGVVQLLRGSSCSGGVGDPTMLVVPPIDHDLRTVRFSTLTSPDITTHSLSIVIPTAAVGTLLLDGSPVNSSLFTSFLACPSMSWARFAISAGSHGLSCPTPFNAYAHGIGPQEGYSFTLGADAPVPPIEPTLVCASGSITLSSSEPLANATWSTVADPLTVLHLGDSWTFTPTSNEVYVVTGDQVPSGCPKEFHFQVGISLPTVQVTANNVAPASICELRTVQLAATPSNMDPSVFDFAWEPAAAVNDPQELTPLAYPTSDTWYKFFASSPVGCGNEADSVLVTVENTSVTAFTATSDTNSLCAGDSTRFRATAEQVLVRDHFNSATPGAMWGSILGGVTSTACGSVTDNALYFNAAGTRAAQTVDMNTAAGGTLHFQLKIATGTAPCDDADPGEDVVLEFSNNGGGVWNLIGTYDQASFPVFVEMQVPIPALAQTAATRFRWRQPVHSGSGQDNWALDNVVVATKNNSGLTFSWVPAAAVSDPSSSDPVGYPSSTGWYKVIASDLGSPCQYADSVYMTVVPLVAFTLNNDTALCSVQSIMLNAAPSNGSGHVWTWTPNNGSLSALNVQAPMATATSTTTYTVTVSSNGLCSTTDSVVVRVNELTSASVFALDSTLCQGEGTTISAVPAGTTDVSYAWNPPFGLDNASLATPQASPNTTTTYICTVTENPTGCTVQDSLKLYVSTSYTISTTNDTVCSSLGYGLSVTHDVPNPTYSWTPAAAVSDTGIQAPSITIDSSQVYTVTVTDPIGCAVSDTITITVPFDDLVQPAPTSFCAGDSVILDAGYAGLAYAWTSGALSQQITVSAGGVYNVVITLPSGCHAQKNFTVTQYALPVLDLGPDTALCGASQLVLDAASPGNDVLWSTGAQTQTVTLTASGNYWVRATSANGCVAYDTINVALNALPADALMDVTTCITNGVTLDAANAGSTYLWSTGDLGQSITPTTSGTYSVTVTTPQNCTDTFNTQVTFVQEPIVQLGTDTAFCAGPFLLLDAENPGSTFSWSTGAATQTISVGTTGAYSVSVDNGYCTASDSIGVVVHALPVNALADTTQCSTQPPVLNAGNSGSTYLWNTGGTTQTIIADTTGTYSVQVTTAQNCIAQFTAYVTLVGPPVVDIGPDTAFCAGPVLVMDAQNAGAQYLWSTGEQSQTIAVNTSGTYHVAVDNGYCVETDTAVVIVYALPVDPLADVTTCVGTPVVLDAGNPGSTYTWSTTEGSQAISVVLGGVYTVQVTNAQGCSSTFDAEVVFVEYPVVELGPDRRTCANDPEVLDAGTDGTTFLWSTGSSGTTLEVTATGIYSVAVGNGYCTATDSVHITVDPMPQRLAENEVLICFEEEPYVALDAGNAGSQYRWATGETSRTIDVSEYGWYAVEITNAFGCILRDSALVSAYCPATLFLPTGFTPNGDGVNDVFRAQGREVVEFELLIYDRGGQLIFRSSSIDLGWDGTANGKDLPSGVYTWRAEYRLDDPTVIGGSISRSMLGHVTLLD
jgi:gliding motility-associated-like protein